MKTINPYSTKGLLVSRKDEGRRILLTQNFGVNYITHGKCECCGKTDFKKEIKTYEGFKKGDIVKVERVESHTDSVYGNSGAYEGPAHIGTVELSKNGVTLRFSFEGLRIPGKFV